MTENRKHLVRPEDRPPHVRGQRRRRGRRRRAGRRPAREPRPRRDQEPPRVRPVPGQAPGLPDAGEPVSFDHYFGTFPGARGFNDPTAIRLPTGRTVFQQPDPANPDGYLEPWHMSTITTGAAAVPSLSHDWRDQHAAWNQGAMDGWLLTHVASDGEANGSFTMGHYTEEDIPFHWALAKAFTLADNYHCSVMGPTDVNRIFWEEGGNDPQGKAGGPVLETGGVRDLTYESGPETLYNAGISYKFYQGIGWPQDTITSYFKQVPVPRAGADRALQRGDVDRHPVRRTGPRAGSATRRTRRRPATRKWASRRTAPTACCPTCRSSGPSPASTSTRRPSRRQAPSSSPPSWRPWPPTRNCGTPPCSSSTTTRTTGSSTTSSRRPRTRPSTPRSSSPWPRRRAPPAAACPSAPGSGSRPSSSHRGRWAAGSSPTCPTTPPACGSSRRWRRPAACPAPGPVTFPNISRWRRKTFSDWTGAIRPGTPPQAAPTSTQFTPATTAANLAAQQAAALLPLPPRPGATQQFR